MKQKLSFKEYVYVASMLFGMFFGAGNLIFPVYMGQAAGRNVWPAIVGFLVTGVGLPLLGVAALGISRSSGLFDLSRKVGRPYAFFFTCALYLTIGPFFAIPRCATTAFTVGLEQVLPASDHDWLYLLLFSLLFFAATLFFSLRPGKILTYVGKILTPCFLAFLTILIIVTMLNPTTHIGAVEPQGTYAAQPFFTGFLEGYNTMDALASLAFGIVVVQVIRDLGVEKAEAVAMTTVRSGIFSCLLMGVIYLLVTVMGTWSRGALEAAPNGGAALAQIAQHYLGHAGLLVLAATFLILRYTKFGRSLYAVGGNQQSAALMGLDVKKTRFKAHVLCSFLTSIGAICYVLNTMCGTTRQALGLEMDAISSAVIGGTLLTGGVGNVIGSVFGVLINGTISSLVKTNGKLSSAWPNVVTAILLCFFIVLQAIFARFRKKD